MIMSYNFYTTTNKHKKKNFDSHRHIVVENFLSNKYVDIGEVQVDFKILSDFDPVCYQYHYHILLDEDEHKKKI